LKTSRAPGSNSGAMTASRNISVRASATSTVTVLLKPTMPPKADLLSVLRADL